MTVDPFALRSDALYGFHQSDHTGQSRLRVRRYDARSNPESHAPSRPAGVVLAGRNTAWAANGSGSATTALEAIDGENAAIERKEGRVLVVGAKSGQQAAEIYDPASATWTRQANPILLRYEDSEAVLLSDGRVL